MCGPCASLSFAASKGDITLDNNEGNIIVRPGATRLDGTPLDYPAEYDNVTVHLTTTGDITTTGSLNYNKEDFRFTVDKFTSSEPGKGVYIWDDDADFYSDYSLKINNDLNISIIPAPWPAVNKIELERVGIHIANNGGKMYVGGNTNILVDNYKYVENDADVDDTSEEEGTSISPQFGIQIGAVDAYSSLEIGKDLDITMLAGNRSMGIYAHGTDAGLIVRGDTSIKVKNAAFYNYGISNFYDGHKFGFTSRDEAPVLIFDGDLDIETAGGNNSVGINLKDNTHDSKAITVGGHLSIYAHGAKEYADKTIAQIFPNCVSNYGMYMYYIDDSSFNSATITTESEGDGVESIGSYAYWYSNMTFDGDVEYNTSATDKDVEISALARAGSNITFNRGLTAHGAVVLNAVGNTSNKASTIKVNPYALTDADVRLDGNIVAGKTTSAYIFGDQYDTMTDNDATRNVISVNLMNANSYLTGVNEFGNAGSDIDLRFENGASWNMTDSSPVTDLVLANGGQADMTYGNASAASGYRNLTAASLSGEGGLIHMNIDAGKMNSSDRVYVTGTHTGEHYIFLNNVNPSSLTDGAEGTVLVSVGKEEGTFSAPQSTEGKLYWYRYELGSKESAEQNYDTDWYLKQIIKENPADKPTTTIEAGLSASALGYHTWRTEMDSLMQRMGDLRQEDEPDNGAWFRVKGGKINRDGAFGFENEYVMYQLGYDDVLKRTDKYTSYIGVAFSYTDGEGSYYRGDGENEGKEFGLYYTKMHDNGHYLDVAVKAGRWDNDFDATDRSGNRISGDYDNNSFAFSAEYGRKIGMGAKGWYIEPQAQLSWGYFSGADYKMSNGVSVHQSGISSLLGRVGFNIGRDINKYSNIYLKANLYHEFCGDYTVSMDDGAGNSYQRSDAFDDTWFEYGVGAAFKWGEDARFYIDAERSAGSDFEKEWTVNAGFAWTF